MVTDLSTQSYPRFMDVCLRFIEENAENCVTSETWLELPKLAVIRLVNSQQVRYLLLIGVIVILIYYYYYYL